VLTLRENPPTTWPTELTLAAVTADWSVAYCKPRQEKSLAWDLCHKEIRYFLPMVLRETISGGRRRRNLYPLFPSYLFFTGDDAERLAVFKTERVVRLIDVNDAQQQRFRQEIASLETAIRVCPSSLELYPRLVPGARVRITAGAMKNVEGVILQADNKKKLWLGISALGVGATVEIHADFVEVN
jgi:transcription antitermination factor NusG